MSGPLTLDHWIRDRAALTPDRVAIDYLGSELTYRELDERSDRLARTLLDAGLARGDRLATLTANSPGNVEAFFACAKAGIMFMPLNWRLSPAELDYQLSDAEPALLLVDPEHDELARPALGRARAPRARRGRRRRRSDPAARARTTTGCCSSTRRARPAARRARC